MEDNLDRQNKPCKRKLSLSDVSLSLPAIRTRKSESDAGENHLVALKVESQKTFSKSDSNLVVKQSRWTTLRWKSSDDDLGKGPFSSHQLLNGLVLLVGLWGPKSPLSSKRN